MKLSTAAFVALAAGSAQAAAIEARTDWSYVNLYSGSDRKGSVASWAFTIPLAMDNGCNHLSGTPFYHQLGDLEAWGFVKCKICVDSSCGNCPHTIQHNSVSGNLFSTKVASYDGVALGKKAESIVCSYSP